jgi:lipopolysaccharide export system permease protein
LSRLIVWGALVGFAVYFLSALTRALGESGIIPVALAAAAPATAAILLGMTLVFHHEDG